jgi:hypothetical protein
MMLENREESMPSVFWRSRHVRPAVWYLVVNHHGLA